MMEEFRHSGSGIPSAVSLLGVLFTADFWYISINKLRNFFFISTSRVLFLNGFVFYQMPFLYLLVQW